MVTQEIGRILDAERLHEKGQLLVRIDLLELFAVTVHRLAAQRENRLAVHVAADFERTGGRITLGQKNHRVRSEEHTSELQSQR